MANAIEGCWSRACEEFARCDSPWAAEFKKVDFKSIKAWPSREDISRFSKRVPAAPNRQQPSTSRRLRNLVEAIHRFAPAFDVFVQQQPFLATIVWGSCRFLVLAVVTSTQLSDKVNEALDHIIHSLVRTSREANLFTPLQPLLDSITLYFTKIITFLAHARRHFGRSRIRRLFRALSVSVFDEALQSIRSAAQETAEELRITALEVHTHEIKEQGRYRTKSSSQLQRIEDAIHEQSTSRKDAGMMGLPIPGASAHRLDATKEHVMSWLSYAVYDPGVIPDAEPGTCNAFQQQPDWSRWATDQCANTLLLTGVQGVGKTVHCKTISARAAEEGQKIVLSYYFGSTGGKQSTQAKSLAATFLWQLLQCEAVNSHPELASILLKFQPCINTCQDVRKCRLDGLLQLLDSFWSLAGKVLLVVDALDECTANADTAVLQNYLFDLGSLPDIKIVISATNKYLLSGYDDDTPHIHLDRKLIEPDIIRYLDRKVRSNDKFKAERDEIVRIVRARSQGIFLIARLLINDLETARSVNEQREKMAHSSDRLSDEYKRQFYECDTKLSALERTRRDQILLVLLAARASFYAQGVTEALACRDSSGEVDENDLVFEPAKEITYLCRPLVEVVDAGYVVFINGSARDFLLKEKHLTMFESELFLTRKCLAALREEKYRKWPVPSRLLRKHLLAGTIYATNATDELAKHSSIYDYATLYFQDHLTELTDPPGDIITNVAAFLRGIEFVSYSEHLLDLTKQSSLGNQIQVYNILLKWTQKLQAPIRAAIPINEYFEIAHLALTASLCEESRDKILQYLPLVRNGNYFNGGGQSAEDWQRAYNYKEKVVAGFTDVLGVENPVTLRSLTSLLQEYFWQKRFDEVLPRLLTVATTQRLLGSVVKADLSTTLWLLGLAYHCLTRLKEALDVFTEAAEGVARWAGRFDRQYLLISLYEGHTLEQLFRFEEAVVLYEDVKKTLTPIVGSANGFTLMSQTAIGAAQRKQGLYEDAKLNLQEGWLGRKKLFSINVNVCLDAAVQLALLYRDSRHGELCLELLDEVSGSKVYNEDFERHCQTDHIRALVAIDSGYFDEAMLALLQLLHKATGSKRDLNNRELMWVRETLAQVMRYLGKGDEALMVYCDVVKNIEQACNELSSEPEPPSQLRLAERAIKLAREGRMSDAKALLHSNGLQWVRDADFYILGQGGPIADTAVIAPIRFPQSQATNDLAASLPA